MGAVENLVTQHVVVPQGQPAISKLAIELEWHIENDIDATMRAPIVRGSPYTSMLYTKTTPRIYAERSLKGDIVIDGSKTLVCGNGKFGEYSTTPVHVNRELRIQFDTSDMTWLVFFSAPMEVECAQYDSAQDTSDLHLPPGVVSTLQSFFDLRATKPAKKAMLRMAMSNNCTSGQNAQCKCISTTTRAAG